MRLSEQPQSNTASYLQQPASILSQYCMGFDQPSKSYLLKYEICVYLQQFVTIMMKQKGRYHLQVEIQAYELFPGNQQSLKPAATENVMITHEKSHPFKIDIKCNSQIETLNLAHRFDISISQSSSKGQIVFILMIDLYRQLECYDYGYQSQCDKQVCVQRSMLQINQHNSEHHELGSFIEYLNAELRFPYNSSVHGYVLCLLTDVKALICAPNQHPPHSQQSLCGALQEFCKFQLLCSYLCSKMYSSCFPNETGNNEAEASQKVEQQILIDQLSSLEVENRSYYELVVECSNICRVNKQLSYASKKIQAPSLSAIYKDYICKKKLYYNEKIYTNQPTTLDGGKTKDCQNLNISSFLNEAETQMIQNMRIFNAKKKYNQLKMNDIFQLLPISGQCPLFRQSCIQEAITISSRAFHSTKHPATIDLSLSKRFLCAKPKQKKLQACKQCQWHQQKKSSEPSREPYIIFSALKWMGPRHGTKQPAELKDQQKHREYPNLSMPASSKALKGSKASAYRNLFILAHGYQGSSQNMEPIKASLKRMFTRRTNFLSLQSYSSDMDVSIDQMGRAAAQQISLYIKKHFTLQTQIINSQSSNNNKKEAADISKEGTDKIVESLGMVRTTKSSSDLTSVSSVGKQSSKPTKLRVIFIGHSMGGLILRSCIDYLDYSIKKLLHTYVSLATPHLGYLYCKGYLTGVGIRLMESLNSSKSIKQLSHRDAKDFRDTFIYKLAGIGSLKSFENIVLFSSLEDRYVTWNSANAQVYKSLSGCQPEKNAGDHPQKRTGSSTNTKTAIHADVSTAESAKPHRKRIYEKQMVESIFELNDLQWDWTDANFDINNGETGKSEGRMMGNTDEHLNLVEQQRPKGANRIRNIYRLSVDFDIKSHSVEDWVGRTSHILFLSEPKYLEMAFEVCLQDSLYKELKQNS